jgi:hypothetical protein
LGNESSEFGSTVLAMVGPAVSQDENIFWGGITTATKLLLLLWFRVLDKVLSLLLQTAAALVAGQVDGVFCKSSL